MEKEFKTEYDQLYFKEFKLPDRLVLSIDWICLGVSDELVHGWIKKPFNWDLYGFFPISTKMALGTGVLTEITDFIKQLNDDIRKVHNEGNRDGKSNS